MLIDRIQIKRFHLHTPYGAFDMRALSSHSRVVWESSSALVPAAVVAAADVPQGKAKPKKATVCWKCAVNTHATKDCTAQHYCLVCDNTEHPTMRCPTLRLPKPSAFTAGFGTDETLFLQLPDSVFMAHLAPTSSPTALVSIVGETVPAAAI